MARTVMCTFKAEAASDALFDAGPPASVTWLHPFICIHQAEAEGEALFDNLSKFDYNADGTVGVHDFTELFKQVRRVSMMQGG